MEDGPTCMRTVSIRLVLGAFVAYTARGDSASLLGLGFDRTCRVVQLHGRRTSPGSGTPFVPGQAHGLSISRRRSRLIPYIFFYRALGAGSFLCDRSDTSLRQPGPSGTLVVGQRRPIAEHAAKVARKRGVCSRQRASRNARQLVAVWMRPFM